MASRPWQARHGLTSDQYQNTFNDLTSQGYRLTCISGYTINNDPRFAVIFEKKPSPEWVSRYDMTSAQYQSAFNEYIGQGYRLTLVNGYTVSGEDRYVAIWEKSSSPQWYAHHGMSSSDYQSAFDDAVAKGCKLRHVSGYSVRSDARYAAIWEKSGDGIAWIARHGLTSTEFQEEYNAHVGEGYNIVLVNGYTVGNVDYYAAIWEKKVIAVLSVRHGMDSSVYQGELTEHYYQGYVLKVVSGYTVDGNDRYAAIWENYVMSAADLEIINNDIKAYMDKHRVPGLSIAITKDERLVFAKGFGVADMDTGFKVNPSHLFRIMSVSKPITATTTMKLIQDGIGNFNLKSTVFGPDGVLGDLYGTKFVNGNKHYNPGVTDITIQNLLEHTSGWGANSDPINALKTKEPGAVVTEILDNVPLKNPPGTVNFYSNFGYLVLGRVIEKATSQTYENYVRSNILNQCQITRMQLGDNSGSLPDEVHYYPKGATEEFRIHQFDSFGGWLATPIDLTRFLVRVDGFPNKPDILSEATLTTMFTPSELNPWYAKGWAINPGWRGHNGGFAGTGSVTCMKTAGDRFSFAAVRNINSQESGDEGSSELRNVVDEICSKVSEWPAYDLF